LTKGDFVEDPVELIVHGPAGSGPDGLATALIAAVGESGADTRPWGRLERSEDPGPTAMRELLEHPGSDRVLSTCTPVFLQAPLLKSLVYSFRNLTPIVQLVADQYLVITSADSPFGSAHAFIDRLRASPTRTGGYFTGSINHLLSLVIAEAVGASVEFKLIASETDLIPALIDGRLDWGVATPVEMLEALERGAIRPVAAVTRKRLARYPDTLTLAEVGAPVEFSLWRGLIGPPAVSEEAQARWQRILRAAIETRAWRDYLTRTSQANAYLDAAAFGQVLEQQNDWYRTRLSQTGLLNALPQ
jgi:putative tricarboxylic transport membrane protein